VGARPGYASACKQGICTVLTPWLMLALDVGDSCEASIANILKLGSRGVFLVSSFEPVHKAERTTCGKDVCLLLRSTDVD